MSFRPCQILLAITRALFGIAVAVPLVCAPTSAFAHAGAFQVEPTTAQLNGNLDRLQILVSGQAADKTATDLTRSVKYESLTPNILVVGQTGHVKPLADGAGSIRVTHGKAQQEIKITVSKMLPQAAVSFRNDVVPLLFKAGCSGGGCHASQFGKGGLKISLFGYAPEQDHTPLARADQQRRISLANPADSLILRKAIMEITHGGGKRFSKDSFDYDLLYSWVAAGAPAPLKDEPKVISLSVTPNERVYRKDDSQQLRVVATYSDGNTKDVTNRVAYDSLGDSVVEVTHSGYLTAIGAGQAAVMIRYQGQALVSQVISPYADKLELAGFKVQNFVDEKIKNRWEKLGISPSKLCTDEVFIRRAFLDSIGTLPAPQKVVEFIESTNPNKRTELIDELLGLTGDPKRDIYDNEWTAYWSLKWGDWLRNNRNNVGFGGMWSLYNWTRQSLRENKPVDVMVREIITAQGSIYENGPANYYKISKTPTDLAENTVQVFLGVRLQCAKCHHHPFEVYSQADYYGLAAFFSGVSTKTSTDFGAIGGDTIVKVIKPGTIRHPRTRKIMKPKPLLKEPIDTTNVRDLRRPLADWLTGPENRLFANNIVNRIWGYYMGTGLVEPIDDMRSTNPPSNPELMKALADDFVANKYDLRKLMRAIMISRTYQLSSNPTKGNAADTRFYTHYNVKRLPAEVMLDAIDDSCGTQEKFTGVPLGTRAIELPDSNFASYFLDTMGRPKRVIACECERTSDPNLAQVLHIANGDLINSKLKDKKGRVAKILADKLPEADAVTQLYLVTLSRKPTAEELAQCQTIIKTAENSKEGYEDVLWALCNTREFLFNH